MVTMFFEAFTNKDSLYLQQKHVDPTFINLMRVVLYSLKKRSGKQR